MGEQERKKKVKVEVRATSAARLQGTTGWRQCPWLANTDTEPGGRAVSQPVFSRASAGCSEVYFQHADGQMQFTGVQVLCICHQHRHKS